MKTVREVLVEGRALIADPGKWTQRTTVGERGGVVTYCSSGAIRAVTGAMERVERLGEAQDAEFHLSRFMGRAVTGYNDSHGHGEVLDRWDMAIAALPEPLVVPEVEPSVRRTRELVPA